MLAKPEWRNEFDVSPPELRDKSNFYAGYAIQLALCFEEFIDGIAFSHARKPKGMSITNYIIQKVKVTSRKIAPLSFRIPFAAGILKDLKIRISPIKCIQLTLNSCNPDCRSRRTVTVFTCAADKPKSLFIDRFKHLFRMIGQQPKTSGNSKIPNAFFGRGSFQPVVGRFRRTAVRKIAVRQDTSNSDVLVDELRGITTRITCSVYSKVPFFTRTFLAWPPMVMAYLLTIFPHLYLVGLAGHRRDCWIVGHTNSWSYNRIEGESRGELQTSPYLR